VPALGYFGAHLDSYLIVRSQEFNKIVNSEQIKFTWSRFQLKEIDFTNSEAGPLNVRVICVSPKHTKKLGMDSPFLFVGEKSRIEIIQFVYSLYNIHYFLLTALLIFGLGVVLLLASQKRVNYSHVIISTVLAASTLFSWSTVFDGLLMTLGVPPEIIRVYALMLWGPTVLYYAIPRVVLRSVLSILWVSLLFIGVATPYGIESQVIYGTYRWMYLSVGVISFLSAIAIRENRYILPYCVLMAFDSLALFGVYSVKAGFYASGFGIFGLYLGANLQSALELIVHHWYWHQRQELSQSLDLLRSSQSTDSKHWKSRLGEYCRLLARHSGAQKVSLCYLALESPVIITFNRGTIRGIEDGLLPPVFARVIQTGEGLWWVSSEQLATYAPQGTAVRRDVYKSSIAVIVPIKVGSDCYGAISLTEFALKESTSKSSEARITIEQTINSFLDLIATQVVRQKEQSNNEIQKASTAVVKCLNEKYAIAVSKSEVIEETLKSIANRFGVASMFFEFDAVTERLHLLGSANMDKDLANSWAVLPFRARATNKLSPFAITINEKRNIFIEAITSLFGILAAPSVDVLQDSRTTAFASLHVGIGEKTLGLIALLDPPNQTNLNATIVASLDLPLKYFAFALEQWNSSALITQQEKALRRFASPELIDLIVKGDENESIFGAVRECVIIVLDLRGSTQASRSETDSIVLARKFSEIYQVASDVADEYAATFDKGNGDGMMFTLPVDDHADRNGLRLGVRLLCAVEEKAKRLLPITGSVVVIHRGKPFRGIIGHTHRIAWDTCGKDINDTYAIEKYAKTIPGVVLAVSLPAIEGEAINIKRIFDECSGAPVSVPELPFDIFLFDREKLLAFSQKLLDERVAA